MNYNWKVTITKPYKEVRTINSVNYGSFEVEMVDEYRDYSMCDLSLFLRRISTGEWTTDFFDRAVPKSEAIILMHYIFKRLR